MILQCKAQFKAYIQGKCAQPPKELCSISYIGAQNCMRKYQNAIALALHLGAGYSNLKIRRNEKWKSLDMGSYWYVLLLRPLF